MTGHKPLVEMRMRGQHPPFVWVQTSFEAYPKWRLFGDKPEVGIEAQDYPDLLDLRFAIGLTVLVEGSDAQRVLDVAKAFERAKAKRVIATTDSGGCRPEVVSISDTQGAMNWPM